MVQRLPINSATGSIGWREWDVDRLRMKFKIVHEEKTSNSKYRMRGLESNY